MYKKLIYPVLLSFVLVSCLENEGAEDDPQPLADCFVSSSVTEGGFFSPLGTQYEYNDQNQLLKVRTSGDTVSWTTQYTYNEKGQLHSENNDAYEYVNEYNSQGQLIKQTRTLNSTGRRESEFYLHTYNSAGQLIETTVHPAEEPTFTKTRFKFNYSNGVNNHIEKTTYAYDGSVPNSPPYFIDDITITYDGKKNVMPVSPLNQYNSWIEYAPLPDWKAGNITSYKMVRRTTGKASIDYTVAYTYTAQGAPAIALVTNAGKTTKRQYSYSCK